MLAFEVRGVFGATWDVLGVDIRHLSVRDHLSGPVVTAATGANGGVMTLRLGESGPVLIDQDVHSAGFAAAASGAPATLDLGNTRFLAVGTDGSGRILGYHVDANGQIGAASRLAPQVAEGPLGLAVQTTPQGFLYSATGSERLQVFRPDGAGGYSAGTTFTDTQATYAANLTDLAHAQIGSAHFLLTAGSDETGVSAFRIDTRTGALTHTDSVGAGTGLGLYRTPTALEVAEVAGRSFVIVATSASSGSGSGGALSVLELSADGNLAVTEHVIDSGHTRWANVADMAVVEEDGWTYVIAGGSDAGVSLLALMPNGRLVHLDTLPDRLDTGLEQISALTGAVVGNTLQVIGASQSTTGLTRLDVDLSDQGDVRFAMSGTLTGSSGNDMLVGGRGENALQGHAGDDILVDGAGADRLTGGAGRDLFVLEADGALDVIADFQPGQDRLDLTAVPFLYDESRLQVVATSWGARLFFAGGEVTELRRAGGGSLSEREVFSAIDWNAHRPLMVLRNEIRGNAASERLTGSDGTDVVDAQGGNDVLDGQGGDDILLGGAGNDTLLGGAGLDELRGGAGRDRIEGGDGADLIYGGDTSTDGSTDPDTIFGGAGNDVIVAAGGADYLSGDDGADSVNGGTGNDTILGGAGNDTLRGGAGRDSLVAGDGDDYIETAASGSDSSADTVRGGAGNDVILSGAGADLLYGDTGADSILSGAGNDTIWGGAQNDTVDGGAGADRIEGQDGADLIRGGTGADWIRGGTSNDTLQGGDDADQLIGDAGQDILLGETGNDWLDGGTDDDLLDGGIDNDTLFGGDGNDTLRGSWGDDRLEGQWGADLLEGGFGNDWIHGGAQADTLLGGNHRDTIFGAFGDDRIEGQFGADRLWGGFGNDWIHGGAMGDMLQGQQGNDTLNGGSGRDTVFLGQGDDVFIGFSQGGWLGQDTIYGGTGNDQILAKTGNDLLLGQLGNDTLSGGGGNDVLIGGAGRDTFIFWTNSGRDVIKDFQPNFDVIHLDVPQRSVSQLEITQVPRGLWIDWGPGEVLLEGMTRAEFDPGDIVFV